MTGYVSRQIVPLSDSDRIVQSTLLYRGWLDLLMLRLRLNGRDEGRPIVRHPQGAAVLTYDPVRRVALVIQQTRTAALFLALPPLTEVVAGAIENGDASTCARQEAEEEAGLALRELTHVGQVIVNPGTSTETIDLFLAEYSPADRIGPGGGLDEENERITVREVGLDALWAELTGPGTVDAKTLLLIQALRIRRPDLFHDAVRPVSLTLVCTTLG